MLFNNKKQTFKSLLEQTLYFPYRHLMLIAVLALTAITLWLDTPEDVSHTQAPKPTVSPQIAISPEKTEPISIDEEASKEVHEPKIELTEVVPQEKKEDKVAAQEKVVIQEKIVIRKGDTLSGLFDHYNLGQATLIYLLSADESLLALETLQPGHILFFRYKEKTQDLEEMELYIHAGHRVVYRRIAADAFNYETIIREGEWRSKTISGKIESNFYSSAQRAGLTEAEAATVTQIFQDQLDFSRVIRKGDTFQIVRNVQFIDDLPTGQTRIDSARVQRRAYEHTAFLFQDGRYYDKQGKSLARALTRTPLGKSYRISSRFNPKRVHPITGRVAPHNGTDFATPTGTKVLSTGDGIVTRVGNHRFAGRYLEIKHGGRFKTRYLHLHRILVRKGASVKRGQAIALSGNTGRSTGPHLHFELHINGRPVNPMKAKIPRTQSISKKDRSIFLARVAQQTSLLDAPNKTTKQKTTKIAINETQQNTNKKTN